MATLYIGNDDQLRRRLSELTSREQLIALARTLGRSPFSVTRAAQRLELMNTLNISEQEALLLQRSGAISLGALRAVPNAEHLSAAVTMIAERRALKVPYRDTLDIWLNAARAAQNITFRTRKSKTADPFRAPMLEPLIPVVLRTPTRPSMPPIPPDPCTGLLKPEARGYPEPTEVRQVFNLANEIETPPQLIKVHGRHLGNVKEVELEAVESDPPNNVRPVGFPDKFVYRTRRPAIQCPLRPDDNGEILECIEFTLPTDRRMLPSLYRVTLLNSFNDACRSLAGYIQILLPNAIKKVLVRVAGADVHEDQDGLLAFEGEIIWVLAGGGRAGDRAKVGSGVVPGRRHLNADDDEFIAFDVPVLEIESDGLGDEIAVVASAFEEDIGSAAVGNALGIIGGAIGAYFKQPGAGFSIARAIGELLGENGGVYGTNESIHNRTDDPLPWGIQRGNEDPYRIGLRGMNVLYSIREVVAPRIVRWAVRLRSITIVSLGRGDWGSAADVEIDVYHRAQPGYALNTTLEDSSKTYGGDDVREGQTLNFDDKLIGGNQNAMNPTAVSCLYVEFNICIGEDQSIGFLSKTISVHDLFVDAPGNSVVLREYEATVFGTGDGRYASCRIDYTVEVAR